jgi:hypothetical protein
MIGGSSTVERADTHRIVAARVSSEMFHGGMNLLFQVQLGARVNLDQASDSLIFHTL